MARYFTRAGSLKPRGEWDDDYPLLPNLLVPEHECVETGILDEYGDPIMRMPNPIGFGREIS